MNLFDLDRKNAGSRKPAICIPLMGKNREELADEIERLEGLPYQMAEWRADYMIAAMSGSGFWEISREVLGAIAFVKEQLDVPVLFTIRTAGEGGMADISKEDYFFINRMVTDSNKADIVDVEAFIHEGADMVREFMEYAHEHDQMVLLSNHDFEKTPSMEELIQKYSDMNDLAGDILKIAVMPQTEDDVACLLQALAAAEEMYPDRMLVAISMGELGMTSRICAGQFGSVMTFAAGKEASAPGQIDAVTLQRYLDEYYK